MCTDQSPGDLTPFLEPVSSSTPFEFVQAILTAWNGGTLENEVTFTGGQVETDLPIIGDPADLAVNDAVMILRSRQRYFILGRISGAGSGTGVATVSAFNGNNPTTNSTSYTSLGGANTLGVAFVAPRSGAVKITVEGWLAANSATVGRRTLMALQVREGSTVDAGSVVEAANDDNAALAQNSVASVFDYRYVTFVHTVSGLTPGADYNVTVMHRIVTGGDNSAANDRHVIVEPVLL